MAECQTGEAVVVTLSVPEILLEVRGSPGRSVKTRPRESPVPLVPVAPSVNARPLRVGDEKEADRDIKPHSAHLRSESGRHFTSVESWLGIRYP